MHYYTRNLGDYAKKAGRLSMLQHGAYTLLLDACYDRERFPTESEAIGWTWASTPEEEQAVKFVLSRFFEIQEDGTYVQSRVKEELALFKIGSIQNRLIAISREARKQKRDDLAKACDQLRDEIKHAPLSKTHEAWTNAIDALIKTHEAPPNQEPITNNQEPDIKPPKSPRKKSPEVDINTFIEQCDESGEDPVPITDPVFKNAEKLNLPPEFLAICWRRFVEKNSESKKKYIDWRAAFRNAVNDNWYKLWWLSDDGSYQLTTAGKQAQKLQESQS